MSDNAKTSKRERFGQLKRDLRDRIKNRSLLADSSGNKIHVFFDADVIYGCQLIAIREAKVEVLLEMYMFESDEVGQMFADAIIDAANRGVRCKVIYDAIGSGDAEPEMFERMDRHENITVVEFRPVAPWRKGHKLVGRDHRKILIVDGRIGFAGGVNLGRPWSRSLSGTEAWRDTHLRLTGPVCQDLQMLMKEVWMVATNEELQTEPNPEPPVGDIWCKVIGGRGLKSRKVIRDAFINELEKAEFSVEITTPYFMPTRKLWRAILRTAERGVKVKLITPKVSDIVPADVTKEGLYPKLLAAGVEIWEYYGPVMHAKSAVFDSRIGLVGSSNLDFLSLAFNREMLVKFDDTETVDELEMQFIDDQGLAFRVTESTFGDWPKSRRLTGRVLAKVLQWLF